MMTTGLKPVAAWLVLPALFQVLAFASLGRAQTQRGEQNPGQKECPAGWICEKHGAARTMHDPAAELSRFRGFRLGSVEIANPPAYLSDEDAGRLKSALKSQLSKALGDAPENGQKALEVDAQITRLRRSRPWVNFVTIAAVFVPLDLGVADVEVKFVDPSNGRVVAVIDAEGCGQIYEVWPSLQSYGQSRLALKKDSRRVARESSRLIRDTRP